MELSKYERVKRILASVMKWSDSDEVAIDEVIASSVLTEEATSSRVTTLRATRNE